MKDRDELIEHEGPRHHRPSHEWRDMVDTPKEVEEKRSDIESAVSSILGGDPHTRRICRLALGDGPWERYETNTAVAAVLLALARRMTGALPAYTGPYVEVDLHLPPHLGGHHGRSFARLRMPVRLLREAFGSEESCQYAVEALSEGAHHDVAANVILLTIIEALASQLDGNKNGAEDKGNNER